MATKFVQSTIQGRLGEYDFEILDENDQHTSVRRVQLRDPVIIEWGQQGRSYPDYILKSYSQIEIIEGGFKLRDIFSGNFDRRRYRARISGPRVAWSGYVQPESRKLSLNPQVDANTMPLLLSDDYEGAKNLTVNLSSLAIGVGNLASNSLAGSAIPKADLRFDGQFVQRDGTTYDYTAIDSSEAVAADIQDGENHYEALLQFLRLSRGRVYRALSTESAVMHELRATGQNLDGWGPIAGTHPVPGDVYEPADKDIFMDRRDSGFENVEQAGTIKINLGSNYNLCHAGTTSITQETGKDKHTEVANNGIYNDGPQIQLNTDDGVSGNSTAVAELGEIDPRSERSLGVRVEWTVQKDTGKSSSLTVTLSDNNGVLSDVSVNGLNKSEVEFGPTSSKIDPIIKFEGEGISNVNPTAYYIIEDTNAQTQRAKTIYDPRSPTGVKKIEIEQGIMPYVDKTITDFGIWAKRFEVPGLSIVAGQPFLAQRDIERAYRPFGIQSVKATIRGLHGPEDLLILRVPDAPTSRRRAVFVCGRGRKVNLKDGTTKISDVEIPSNILPTQVL